MDLLDSTASSAGLSILSLGSPPGGPQPSPPVSEQFAQKLQTLTAALADPQALAAELSASGLLEQTPKDAAGAAALLEELAELVARLLRDGVDSEADQVPVPTLVPAESDASPANEPTPTDGELAKDNSAPTTTLASLNESLVQTLIVFALPPPLVVPTAPITETVPAPAGLIQTLMPSISPTPPVLLPFTEPNVTDPVVPVESLETDPDPDPEPLSIPEPFGLPSPRPLPLAPGLVPVLVQVTATSVALVTDHESDTSTSFASDTPMTTASALAPTSEGLNGLVAATPRFPEIAHPAPLLNSDSPQPSDETPLLPVRAAGSPTGNAPPTDIEASTTPARISESNPETSSDQIGSTTFPTPTNTTSVSADPLPAEPRTLPPHDSARLVERLGQYVIEARDQGRQLSVQITPPDLGPLHIEVSTHLGELTARLTTESTVAQQLLQEHLPQLQEALSHLGANVERIDVVRTEALARDREWDRATGVGASTDWSASSGQSSPERREEPRRPNPSSRRESTSPKPAAAVAVGGSLQELNVRI